MEELIAMTVYWSIGLSVYMSFALRSNHFIYPYHLSQEYRSASYIYIKPYSQTLKGDKYSQIGRLYFNAQLSTSSCSSVLLGSENPLPSFTISMFTASTMVS